jgi:hypothetical protein
MLFNLYAFLSEANKFTKIGEGFFEFHVFKDLICIDFTFLNSQHFKINCLLRDRAVSGKVTLKPSFHPKKRRKVVK